jgi:tRNA G10  N-methylase Trm11
MYRYFIILGKTPGLSVAELLAQGKRNETPFTLLHISREVAIFSSESAINVVIFMRQLGGTVKIGDIVGEMKWDDGEDQLHTFFSSTIILAQFLKSKVGKVHFGISMYDGGADSKLYESLTYQQRLFHKEVKDNLAEAGRKAGFVRFEDTTLSSVSVEKNDLLKENGFEMVLIATPSLLYVGHTRAVQEFESFSTRDYGRPRRDRRSGIMPPKLARMMINLSQIPKNGTLLDPFCGSGTIVTEAVILGISNIVGTDMSGKAIGDSRQNLDWVRSHFSTAQSNVMFKITDVRNLSRVIGFGSIDAIATEPFLGPPHHSQPNQKQAENILQGLKVTYLDAFQEFKKVLKTGGRVVMLFPVFGSKGQFIFLDILDDIKRMGFILEPLLPDTFDSSEVFQTKRGTVVYGSPEHFVKREILRFRV